LKSIGFDNWFSTINVIARLVIPAGVMVVTGILLRGFVDRYASDLTIAEGPVEREVRAGP
jgi:hypothetical protein